MSEKDLEVSSLRANVVSDDDMATVGSAQSSTRSSPTRRQRKRVLNISSDGLSSSSGSEAQGPSVAKPRAVTPSKRGRGRPPTTRQCVGMAAARKACLRAQREEREFTESARTTRQKKRAAEGSVPKPDAERRLHQSAEVALTVAAKSSSPKGTYVRALKELAATVKEATEDLVGRTATEEAERLRAINAKQEQEILQLRKELDEIRRELATVSQVLGNAPAAAPAPNTEEEEEELRLQRIMRAVGTMLDARFAGLEGRLLPEPRMRPPLAADRRKSREKSPDPPMVVDATLNSAPLLKPVPSTTSAKKRIRGPRRKATAQVAPPGTPTLLPAPASLIESWSTVTRRGTRPREGAVRTVPVVAPAEAGKKNPSSAKRKEKMLRPPRSQAVVLKLQPEAVERGLTYRSVLAEARAKVDPGALGIPIQRIRSAVTGAKVLVVEGADQSAKADLLAQKLREVLSAEGVIVTRPVTTAAIRISGLDDSLTPEEVAAELARIGECTLEAVKIGEIKSGPSGMGQVLVRLPVAAATKVLAVPKLRVGWSVLRAHLLEAKKLQCFRCHELGHVSARCPSSVDRSRDCYRCGQTGHVASGCSLAPHCAVCASAGRPADHVSGSKACAKSPRPRPRRGASAALENARRQPGAPPRFDVVERGCGFVAVLWAEVFILGVYFSPNRTLAEFEVFLSELSRVVGRSHSQRILVLGDLNAKSLAWGSSRTCPRGRAVEEWLVGSGLLVLNRGAELTCVRRLGGSVIDVTFATPDVANRVRGWAVMVGEETLSDHRYIRFGVAVPPAESIQGSSLLCGGGAGGPRWAQKRLNVERLCEAAVVQAWRLDSLGEPADVCEGVEHLREAMSRVCDAAMPRIRALAPKRRVHWWTEEIASQRRLCDVSRRAYQRYRRRRTHRDPDEEDRLYEVYRMAIRALRVAIGEAKEAAWNDLLASLDCDPWGRPYRLARNVLRPWAPPATSTLPPETLQRVVGGLFPDFTGTAFVPPVMTTMRVADGGEPADVSQAEFESAVQRMRAKRTAPGPDGISSRAWALALTGDGLGPALRRLFSRCLREGRFPEPWRTGRLVLIPKEGRPRDEPNGYRPIVVLDEAGKLFERVIANRLVQHLENVGPDLAPNQYGFRRGRSTVDAVLRAMRKGDESLERLIVVGNTEGKGHGAKHQLKGEEPPQKFYDVVTDVTDRNGWCEYVRATRVITDYDHNGHD
ncbi:uncharacterized protein LOC119630099 [Bombyx mori]|uniref:CCHC-type domain-containing protein n=1 Tax=Bombyx mori TaxID=7091 RepID=A0A8R2R779_BOMMO|nr:uncharacterized protein LOC119630099 [Bombyx mori]